MDIVIPVLIGYLIGSFNLSYLIARVKGFDIRTAGSGNAGGSNALITMGSKIGVLCMVVDFLKAFLLSVLTHAVFPESQLAVPCVMSSCILGHIFPFYMGFHGGKGLASLGGALLAFSPKVFLILLLVELVILFTTQYLCFVPITASIAFPVLYGVMTHNLVGALILAPIPFVIFWKHLINLRRIRSGSELRIRYLWKKDQEKQRVTDSVS